RSIRTIAYTTCLVTRYIRWPSGPINQVFPVFLQLFRWRSRPALVIFLGGVLDPLGVPSHAQERHAPGGHLHRDLECPRARRAARHSPLPAGPRPLGRRLSAAHAGRRARVAAPLEGGRRPRVGVPPAL